MQWWLVKQILRTSNALIVLCMNIRGCNNEHYIELIILIFKHHDCIHNFWWCNYIKSLAIINSLSADNFENQIIMFSVIWLLIMQTYILTYLNQTIDAWVFHWRACVVCIEQACAVKVLNRYDYRGCFKGWYPAI